ncbi:hypothetical protein [Parapedobacter koreensis]|uniref:Uncharacterized protein n=1 Tax=Parapedobacter koreensis TaxID=332977 RepID=A0A1H7SQQ3_9SPHI|nr:hypothetical protein [Parapedobacter koreensis]SEL74980.1 hypothetical protein SAMN05421740_109138 [Parapedobacter koreensis]
MYRKLIFLTGLCTIMIALACEKQTLMGSPEAESLQLEALRQEVDSLAAQYSCADVEQWRFTAIGEKACGGPAGFIAYSTQMDTTAFLIKVATYTELQKEYNRKWDVVSDCMLLLPPDRIICEGGKPKLVWDEPVTEEQ